jgi:hypothetical protein
MGNFSLQKGPHTFWKSRTSPFDSCLLLLPLPPPLPRLPRSASAADRRHRTPSSTSSCYTCPGVTSCSSAAVSLSSWPRARAPRRPRAIAGRHLLVVVDSSLPRLNLFSLARSSTTSTHTSYSATPSAQFRTSEPHFPAAVLFHSGRARHHRGQPSPAHPRPNQHLHKLPHCLLVLDDQLLSSNFHRSFVPDESRRRRPRPHRGQLDPSPSTPTRHRSQHHIITPKLPDPFIGSLVHHHASPTLAGVLPRRRRFGLRRSPLIQCLFFQLIVPTRSP